MIDFKNCNQSNLYYLIGLIASDGNLSPDGRHINITSKDIDLLVSLKVAFNLKNKLAKKQSGYDKKSLGYVLQFGDVKFYKFLNSIGLFKNKSLTIGELIIPEMHFHNFLRGEIDGDGCIYSWRHSSNGNQQWSLNIISASPVFISWIKKTILLKYNFDGKQYSYIKENGNSYMKLKYGKIAAKTILQDCYYTGSLALERKRERVKKLLSNK